MEYDLYPGSVRRIKDRHLESAEMKSAALAAAERYYETHQLPAKRPKLCSQGHGNATYVAEKCPMNHFTHPALCRVHADAVPQPAAVALLTGFYESVPGGKALYEAAEESHDCREFPDRVLLNVAVDGESIDLGDESKRITSSIHDDDDPVAKALGVVVSEYLPNFVVAKGQNARGEMCTERVVLHQSEISNAKALRDNGIRWSVHQVLHSDKDPSTGSFEDICKTNLGQFRSGEGPVSIWVGQPKEGQTLSVVGYLGSHKPAYRCA